MSNRYTISFYNHVDARDEIKTKVKSDMRGRKAAVE
jgi:hypothetical protein